MLARRLEARASWVTASDGEQASAARDQTPAVILMDLDPVLDGWAATRRIKDDAFTRSIPYRPPRPCDEQRPAKRTSERCGRLRHQSDRQCSGAGKIKALLGDKADGNGDADAPPKRGGTRRRRTRGVSPRTEASKPRRRPPRRRGSAPGTILVVDDTEPNRACSSAVAAPGVRGGSRRRRRGGAGLARPSARFDAILLDVMMPGRAASTC